LNDGIDSLHANNDIAPFKNILNDMYAKDISVKSRTALRTKARKGEFLGAHAPYGYLRDPGNKNRLIINPETAPTAKRVFDLVISGLGFTAIATIFNAEGIMSPGDYAKQLRQKPSEGEYVRKYKWTKETLCMLARNQMYVGDMVQCRKRSESYRTQKIQWNKKEDWVIVEGTHEGIVSREMYDRVQRIIDGRTRIIKKKDEPHLFSGFFYCENCGNRMAHHVRSGYGDYFSCGKYRAQGRQACSSHHIKVDTLAGIVLADIQENVHLIEADEEKAIRQLEAKKCADEEKRLSLAAKELAKQKKRQSEIDYRIKKVYEDNVAGKLPDNLFQTFLQDYEKEKVELRDSVISLEKTVRYLEANRTDVSQFITLMKQYAGITELTRPALMALIERITVEEPPDSYGRTHHPQTIHIRYKYVGEI
jgi:DNA invertase Pin-like site-specific DNA recombinase